MQIINITDKKQLDDFVGAESMSQFLQSWQWGEFQKQVSGVIWRIGVVEGKELLASAKLVKKQLPMGRSYFYCGRGPIFKGGAWNDEAGSRLFKEIERLALEESIMFLRFDPLFSVAKFKYPLVKTIDVQPSKTAVLDLSLSEDDILKNMHQKTRYNIKLAEKKGVKIVESGAERFEEFWELMASTSDRDEFNLHGRSYYKEMLKLEGSFLKLFFAEYRGKPLVANLVVFFGDTVTYVHGGSSNENREVMAPYALQWQTIKFAKKMNYNYYDFHGVDEAKWPGVTRFKLGFGPKQVDYQGTFDLVYDQSWYSIYKMVRKVRRSF
ncbi:MAG: peptidoglycan bridge formation glycyltransferase FemA/FemB family protein [bacterium]|nr:peptidoglycan bridge formation glycyltransferase FemA/FemB family protein [bacterium]